MFFVCWRYLDRTGMHRKCMDFIYDSKQTIDWESTVRRKKYFNGLIDVTRITTGCYIRDVADF